MTRFIDNKDGTVTDTLTNLMWQQDIGIQLAFEDAQEYAVSLTLAGHNNWRLPTIEELESLINHDKNGFIFECISDYYWSDTIVDDYPNHVWVMYFNYGINFWGYKDYCNYVRCVRDIKKE